jgi:catechol 2,3-dioxygenase-like lactoylglutathione lyase family enzyme
MRWMLLVAAALTACSSSREAPTLADVVKGCGTDAELGCPRPIFNVRDLRAGQAYFRDALGFKVDWVDPDGDFGAVSRGDAQLFLCERCQGTPGAWAWVFARDVDRLHAEFVERGATILERPSDRPWGMREMRVADRDGNVLRFGGPIER